MSEICIAICTCDRHDMLRDLLAAIAGQPGHRHSTILIADNGSRPAQKVVAEFRDRLHIVYERVAESGLCPVRNRTLAMAIAQKCRYLALIDDDEFPHEDWLAVLSRAMEATGADIVHGSVEPRYLAPPPAWAVASECFHKPRSGGTENVLIRMAAVPQNHQDWFRDPFNRIGGEDMDFFRRMKAMGATEIVVPEAVVHEWIPPARLTLGYVFRRALRYGVCEFHRRDGGIGSATPGRTLNKALPKFAYAADHLVRAPFVRGRHLHDAARDIGYACGLLLSLCGIEFAFYGARPQDAATPRDGRDAVQEERG
ncbi:MAG: glycosyltransferase [Rhizobiaceae bacterium]